MDPAGTQGPIAMNQMRPFSLPEAFNIEFDGIDAEHQMMVAILNDFARRIDVGGGGDFEAGFADLIRCMTDHFANEEAYMEQFGYPGLDWHREHHLECVAACQGLLDDCRGAGTLKPETIQACFHQIVTDIARSDLKFKEFLVAQGLVAG